MLLKHDVLQAIESGRIEAVFRKWSQPRVKAGSTLRTAVGLLEVIAVDAVEPGTLTAADADAAGFGSVAELMRAAGDRGRTLFRIQLRYVGPDPRVSLRESIPDESERDEIERRLDHLDAVSGHGPWAWQTLELIAEHPGVRAEDLAGLAGREKKPFKLDVRKLKELGLTESLVTGYQLSPRGKTVLYNRR